MTRVGTMIQLDNPSYLQDFWTLSMMTVVTITMTSLYTHTHSFTYTHLFTLTHINAHTHTHFHLDLCAFACVCVRAFLNFSLVCNHCLELMARSNAKLNVVNIVDTD